MSFGFLGFLKGTFEDVDKLDHETMRQLAIEAKDYLRSLDQDLSSNDPLVKEEAVDKALEIKEFLEGRMTHISESSGITAAEFRETMNASSMFTKKEKETIAEISDKLEL